MARIDDPEPYVPPLLSSLIDPLDLHMGLADLPDDILLQVALTLSVRDVLALKQVSHQPVTDVARLTTEHADMSWFTRLRKFRLPLAQARGTV